MSFDLQPTLVGENLKLRPLVSEDLDQLFAVSSDTLVWEQHPFPRYEKSEFTEFFKVALESKSALVVIDSSSGKMIGTSRYYD